MASDPDLATSDDFMPVAEWLERSGLTAEEQWQLGFGLSVGTNGWDAAGAPARGIGDTRRDVRAVRLRRPRDAGARSHLR